ncbi:UNVERIFIED_CONTAM: hypothetical protein FKN15_075755 [Acipenser sinensis]
MQDPAMKEQTALDFHTPSVSLVIHYVHPNLGLPYSDLVFQPDYWYLSRVGPHVSGGSPSLGWCLFAPPGHRP